MDNYKTLLNTILEQGETRGDRTGVGTKSIFGYQLRFNLDDGFPLLPLKKMFWNVVTGELAWFIAGDTNIGYLRQRGVHIWDQWADENGDLGPVYGAQLRNFNGVDQLAEVYNSILHNPYSRRHMINLWNSADIPAMKLPPCHFATQFYVRRDKYLDLHLNIRSSDTFIGLPYNIAEYALFDYLMAQWTNYSPGELIVTLGDAHIYLNHLEQVNTLLKRPSFPLPTLYLLPNKPLTFEPDTATLVNYQCHPYLPAPVAL